MNYGWFLLAMAALIGNWPAASIAETTVLDVPAEYDTIQEALDDVSGSSPIHRYVIRLAAGEYHEQVALNKSYVTLQGAGRESTKITGDIFTGDASYSGMLITLGQGLEATDLTLENTHWRSYEPGIALSNANTKSQAVFRNVLFTTPGKDTIWLSGDSSYEFYDCRIEGRYDIVTAYASTLYLDNCELEISDHGQAIFWLGGGPNQRTFVTHSRLTVPTATNFLSIHLYGSDGSLIYLYDSDVISQTGGVVPFTYPADRYVTIVTVAAGPSAARHWRQYE